MDFKNDKEEIQVVRMPKTIEKVPDKLPTEITSLKNMFTGATSFNQDLSTWNVKKLTEHSNFANYSGITNPNKLPKFKNNIITIK